MSDLRVHEQTTRLVTDLNPYEKNSRTHSDEQIEQVSKSIEKFGFTNPVLIDENNTIIAGHCRVIAANVLDIMRIPCVVLKGLSEAEQRAYVIADNKLALNAGWDLDILREEFDALRLDDFDLSLTGFGLAEIGYLFTDNTDIDDDRKIKGSLVDKFLIPPFSVFDARQGYWQDRKRLWGKLGIKSHKGRGDYDDVTSTHAKAFTSGQHLGAYDGHNPLNETSIFDPVLCEIIYRWFTPDSALILDPFAGGSVRGIVAAKCNRQYLGVDLRDEQIKANMAQLDDIDLSYCPVPNWIAGDSRNIDKIAVGIEADLVFSCPPYADLEVYSDDVNDISTLKYPEFIKVYRDIIAKTCALLKPDRFACFVVGDIRDKKGNYQNFVSDTIQAFIDAGLKLYNEAILITPNGTLSLRAGKQFAAGRKLGKGHQNVLVFIKGDSKKATQYCGDVEVGEIEVNDDAE